MPVGAPILAGLASPAPKSTNSACPRTPKRRPSCPSVTVPRIRQVSRDRGRTSIGASDRPADPRHPRLPGRGRGPVVALWRASFPSMGWASSTTIRSRRSGPRSNASSTPRRLVRVATVPDGARRLHRVDARDRGPALRARRLPATRDRQPAAAPAQSGVHGSLYSADIAGVVSVTPMRDASTSATDSSSGASPRTYVEDRGRSSTCGRATRRDHDRATSPRTGST